MKTTFLKTIFVFLISYGSLVFAQDLSKIENGKYLKNAVPVNSEWSAVPDLVAVHSNKVGKTDNRKKISEKNNIVFYERTKNEVTSVRTIQALSASNVSNEKVVVFNNDRKILGILSGNIIVKAKNPSDIELITQDYSAIIVRKYEHLGQAIIKFDNRAILESKFEAIRQDSRVKKIEYEIISGKQEAH